MDQTPIVPPIYRGTVFEFETTDGLVAAIGDHRQAYSYGRYDNPTVVAFEQEVARLEHADRALAFGSGMAAISTAVFALLEPGGRVVRQRELYGGTVELFTRFVPRVAGEIREVSALRPEEMEHAIREGTDLVYLETPVNPTLDIVDLQRMADAAAEVGAVTLVDNTFSTPLGQRPLELGIDVSLHSATKYLGGHHDVVAGVAALSEKHAETVWEARKILGGVQSPDDAYLLLRGLRTLPLRWEAATRTAASLARRLSEDPRVARVNYPGLESHPGHEIAARQMHSFGAMLSFDVGHEAEDARRFLDSLRLIRRAGTLGGVESVATVPARVSHAGIPAEERERMGIRETLVRISVGTEPEEELVADLERGLATLPALTA